MAKNAGSNPTDHCRSLILDGKMISIDPSSGKSGVAGYAEFDGGYLVSYGVLSIPFSTQAYKRFQNLRKKIISDFDTDYKVLVIELLKGRSRNYNVKPVLKQAAAVTAASFNWEECVHLAPMSWQAIAKRIGGWVKDDAIDAVYQGYAAIAFANGYKSTWKKEAQLAFLEELATEYKWKIGDWNGSNSGTEVSN
jgi:hypothetical protein